MQVPKQDSPLPAPPPEGEAEPRPIQPPKGAKERIYDKIPLTVRQLDLIIGLLILAFVVVLVLGVLKGNGLIY